jgi:4-hydroxy-3-methylbut-2-enyl diphosphate reductase
MKINLAKSAGFCFGVKRALDIALKTASTHPHVYMMGNIVHNEDVTKQIEHAGIKKIAKLTDGKDKTFLLQAHGVGLDFIKKIKDLGYNIIDATCPMVKEIHGIARNMETQGYKIIIIGDKNHDEVRGIVGQLENKPILIEDASDIRFNKKISRAAVVVQSTQNVSKVLTLISLLKPYTKELKFFNTICRPTRLKQEDIKKMPLENDVMVIIGSKTSANTKRLYEISRSINKRSYRVHSKKDLKPGWFKNADSVGVTAGASTPDRTIKEIISCIRAMS